MKLIFFAVEFTENTEQTLEGGAERVGVVTRRQLKRSSLFRRRWL